jgi:hypothetical protein
MRENIGNHLIIMDFDRTFEETPDAVIINSGDTIVDDPESLKKIFYDADKKHLTDTASCDCGYLKGNFWDAPCPICHTYAVTNFTRKLDYKYWIEIPAELPPVLHPMAFHVLGAWMGTKVLTSLLNIDAPMPSKFSKFFGSGMKYFYENFDYIVNQLATSKLLAPAARKKTPHILKFLEMYKHCLFVRKLPILNQSLHMVNRKGKVTYADECMKDIMKTLVDLTCIRYERFTPSTINATDRNLYNVYNSYYNYAEKIITEKIISKKGFIRRNMLGARLHMTARMVITPLTGPHWGDELMIPWVVGVSQYKCEIINVLTRRMGLTIEQAKQKWVLAQVQIVEEVKQAIEILLDESPYKAFPCLLGRNPNFKLGILFVRRDMLTFLNTVGKLNRKAC